MICPDCQGRKTAQASALPDADSSRERIACVRCGGKGEVPDEQEDWIRMGRELRIYRTRSLRISLRDRAQQLGIHMSVLSQMEHGLVDPSPIFERALRGNPNM